MRVQHLTIANFRGIDSLIMQFAGEHAVLIGPNGGGKTAVLGAAAKALGLDRTATLEDFTDRKLPVELICVLDDLPASAAGEFAAELTFGATTTLTLGMRATLESGELEVVNGFPEGGWRRATRSQLASLPAFWLPAWRDPARLLALTGPRSIFAGMLKQLQIEAELTEATEAVATAASALANAAPLVDLLRVSSEQLRALAPGIPREAFSLGQAASVELLRVLALRLSTTGPAIDLPQQSSGLAQLSILAMAIGAFGAETSAVLLVDEPEVSLHPHAQRAVLAALREAASQTLIATHSAAALDRTDPRSIHRLVRVGSTVAVQSPAVASNQEARRIMRYADPRISEAFFASSVLLVEGASDRLAILELATKLDRDLDAEGISVTALDGAGTFGTMYGLLGPDGLDIPLGGLCDADAANQWAKVIATEGEAPGREEMQALGFLVADPDLEVLLVDALGETGVQDVILSDEQSESYRLFAQQPPHRSLSVRDVLIKFVKKDKVRWAPLIVQALADSDVPRPLVDVLARARA